MFGQATGRIFISHHVIFDERVFPFASNVAPDISLLTEPVLFPSSEPVVQNASMRHYDLQYLLPNPAAGPGLRLIADPSGNNPGNVPALAGPVPPSPSTLARVNDPPQATGIMPPRRAHRRRAMQMVQHLMGQPSLRLRLTLATADHSPAGLPPSPAHALGPPIAAPVWPMLTHGGRVVRKWFRRMSPYAMTRIDAPSSPSLSHTVLLEVIRSGAQLWKTSWRRFTTTRRGRWFLAHLIRISLAASGCLKLNNDPMAQSASIKLALVAKGFTQ